jgi:phosphoglucomutase
MLFFCIDFASFQKRFHIIDRRLWVDQIVEQRINEWLGKEYDDSSRNEIKNLLDKNEELELIDRFSTELEFGTAGLRGTLGAGSNRMNIYVVRKATQGLANYILKKGGAERGVLIGRDSRIMSDSFAEETASVMIANGIRVYYFKDIHPTPTVSFGVRHLNTIAGIMITASHNPKEYNGYKVIWEDGAQVTPPYDKEIISEVRDIKSLNQVKFIPFTEAIKSRIFAIADERVDGVYLENIRSLSLHRKVIKGSDVKICYSPLYGTGYRLVPEILKQFGFKNIQIVEEQAIPDGRFPSAPHPNPEEREAMEVGMKVSRNSGSDIFIATDPDADRLGAMVKKDDGTYALLNGNQIASLLGYYIISELKITGKMPENPRLIKTIVTTDTLKSIALSYGVKVEEVLTGFKWIGLKIKEYEESGYNFIFGCEESHGYLAGTFVRDKDAIIAAAIFAELAAYYQSVGISPFRVLEDIYSRFGYYSESQKSVTTKGIEGTADINKIMEKLRTDFPEKIGLYDVLEIIDLKNGTAFHVPGHKSIPRWELPVSDVVILKLSDNAKIVSRPSGTEPKIKFYFTTYGRRISDNESVEELMNRVNAAHDDLKKAFMDYLGL